MAVPPQILTLTEAARLEFLSSRAGGEDVQVGLGSDDYLPEPRSELIFLPEPTGNSEVVSVVREHWTEICKGKPIPRRDQIDPIRIWQCITFLTLVDYELTPFRIRLRLIGSEAAYYYPGQAPNRFIDQMNWPHQDIAEATLIHARVLQERRPVFGLASTRYDLRESHTFEWAVFPLSYDGTTVSGALRVEDHTTALDRPRWEL